MCYVVGAALNLILASYLHRTEPTTVRIGVSALRFATADLNQFSILPTHSFRTTASTSPAIVPSQG